MRVFRFSGLYLDSLYGPDLRAAHLQAQRFGLGEADCQDCAMDFLLHKLTRHKDFKQDSPLRYRCAHDFACDAHRIRATRVKHEILATDMVSQEATSTVTDWPDTHPNLEQEVLRQAFWEVFQPFFDQLQSVPRQVVQLHYQESRTIPELAATFGRTPHAINQMLSRSRQRLLALMVRAELDATELFSYLTSISLTSAVCPGPAKKERAEKD